MTPSSATEDAEVVVTICIPSYNRGDLVSETLDSLRAQTDPRWEAVVVDDGSTDNSVAVVSAYSRRDSRIRLMTRNRTPKGACACRNIAVEHARGRFVLFLDTDDLLAPFCVEQRVKVMDSSPGLDFAVFSMLLFEDAPENADRLWNVDTGGDELIRVLHHDPVCQSTGTLWRRDSFIRVGMWDEQLPIWQDIELHLRAFSGEYRFAKRLDLPPDTYLRENRDSLSRAAYHSREKLAGRALVVKRAVVVLRQSARADLVPELRYLCASVILGATASGNMDIARDLRAWARREGVFTPAESGRLGFTELCRRTRLDRIPGVRGLRDRMNAGFRTDSTLGQVRLATL